MSRIREKYERKDYEKGNQNPARPHLKWDGMLENLFIVIMAFYPLRHIAWGLDFWDTGYNYANFQYMEHMDSMWFFSTYLANVTGNLLTKLPGAGTLQGMNLYTGLSVSILALTGYFFCTRKLKMPGWLAFLGEMAAISLCWCPTALLYNYLTYIFFLASSILLYLGLTRESHIRLFLAGVFLGMNVLVRFSDLPEAAMILAVWAYDIILWREGKAAAVKETRQESLAAANGSRKESRQDGFWPRLLRHTLWCLLGYAAALAVLFIGIQIRYGMTEYVQGIGRLFAMTESATDYTAKAMVKKMLDGYMGNLYWVYRILIIAAGGMILFAAADWLEERLNRRLDAAGSKTCKGVIGRGLHTGVRVLWIFVCAAMVVWMYVRGFSSFWFTSYDSIWYPGHTFLTLTMTIAAVRIFSASALREEKLISGMLILMILLTSLGSNNGNLPSLNNLFLAAPYALWEIWRFLSGAGDKRIKGGLILSSFPVKGVAAALLGVCLFQFGCFGAKFVFAEATGVQNATAAVENNVILRNIRMEPQKAAWMTELSAYVEENGLQGKEVILYGWIPSLSYYLQMPCAFNPWSELDSYGLPVMEEELAHLEGMIREQGAEKPVVILENIYGLCEEEGMGVLERLELAEEKRTDIKTDQKWQALLDFMAKQGYEQTFRNEKFAVYR